MSIFDEFDANFDTAGLAKDAAEAAKNGNTRREVPHGTYEVEINKLELGKSKKGDPMFSCWFKILTGEYKGKHDLPQPDRDAGFPDRHCGRVLAFAYVRNGCTDPRSVSDLQSVQQSDSGYYGSH